MKRPRLFHGMDAVWIEGSVADLRYALRRLRLAPGFTTGVVLTLGLGIGANAAMFGIVDRLLFRAPAYLATPAAVHRVYFAETDGGAEHAMTATSYRRYLDLARWTTSFDVVAAVLPFHVAVGMRGDARELPVQLVSSSFWRLFDATPAAGRFFGIEADVLPSGSAVAVLSYDFWHINFGGRRDIVGAPVRIGKRDFTVVGVAPKGFIGTSAEPPVAYLPFAPGTDETGGTPSTTLATGYGWAWLDIIVRRKPGLSVEIASADLTRAFQQSSEAERAETPRLAAAAVAHSRAMAAPLLRDRGPLVSDDAKLATWLLGVAAIVLLIACANVGNLLLARGLDRRRDTAVRLALGTSRGRILRQALMESALLAAIGGALGLAIAQGGGRALHAALVADGEWTGAIADPRVLGVTALATFAAAMLSGIVPALHAIRRTDVASQLRGGSRQGAFRRSRLSAMLLVMQVALSVMLLAAAGWFVVSVHRVRGLRMGFEPARVLYVRLEMRGESLEPDESAQLRERLLARARGLVGIEAAARTLNVPFRRTMTKNLFVAGIDSVARLGRFDLQAVSPGYFHTMGTRILAGRPIGDEDRAGGPPVIVVSRSMARALWPGRDALGQCVNVLRETASCRTVVGIAEDIRGRSLRDDSGLAYYLSLDQFAPGDGGLFVRTRGDASLRAEQVRHELQALMRGDSYVVVTPFAEILAPSMRPFDLAATMFTTFGTLALVVAAIGLYSVVAFAIARRAHELGVRIALGARRPDVLRLVLGESLRMATAAVAIGIVGALAAGRWIAPLLFDTSPSDPRVLGAVAAGLIVIAASASLVPALRASRVDPNVALRTE